VDESQPLFIKKPTKTPLRTARLDVNLINITALLGGELKRYNLRTLYPHPTGVYEERRPYLI